MNQLRISIFEDNRKYRESLEFIILSSPDLSLNGSFADTTRLQQRIAEHNPDVVLMDINIPGMSGIEAVMEIKKHFPHIQVCMQTVFEEDDKVFASLCAGASGYILKNTPAEKVLQAIREVAEGGAFFNPTIARKILFNFQQQPKQAEYIQLSEREKEILKLLVDGLSYKMIADACNVSFHTIHTHVKNIYEKLHVSSKGEAVAKAIRNKLV
ncbi:MAG TPA: response regulator transcription factor [Chitinophagaceae bacterium]|nr:response regulator transcription factor [Chitinophagaceae bacterium]